MAGDTTIQTALETLLQARARFRTADVTLGDTSKLAASVRPRVVILPGPVRSRRGGDWGTVYFTWTHYIQVWRRWPGDTYVDIVADRQDVIDTISSYPTLNGTSGISDCTVIAGDRPMYLWRANQSTDAKPALVGFQLEIETIEKRLYDDSGEFA